MLTVFSAKSQEPIFSQDTMNKFLINPAYAGSEGYTTFNLTARQQWLGFEDAPMIQAISGANQDLENKSYFKVKICQEKNKKTPS